MEVRILKADGEVYRYWHTTVETVSEDRIVTIDEIGEPVGGPGGGWRMKFTSRTTYWRDKPYNLGELYESNGRLKEIYIHIGSPPRTSDRVLEFIDYELDVVKKFGRVRVVDEDEFVAAASQYGYSAEHCSFCEEAVREAVELARRWRPAGPPRRAREGNA